MKDTSVFMQYSTTIGYHVSYREQKRQNFRDCRVRTYIMASPDYYKHQVFSLLFQVRYNEIRSHRFIVRWSNAFLLKLKYAGQTDRSTKGPQHFGTVTMK